MEALRKVGISFDPTHMRDPAAMARMMLHHTCNDGMFVFEAGKVAHESLQRALDSADESFDDELTSLDLNLQREEFCCEQAEAVHTIRAKLKHSLTLLTAKAKALIQHLPKGLLHSGLLKELGF